MICQHTAFLLVILAVHQAAGCHHKPPRPKPECTSDAQCPLDKVCKHHKCIHIEGPPCGLTGRPCNRNQICLKPNILSSNRDVCRPNIPCVDRDGDGRRRECDGPTEVCFNNNCVVGVVCRTGPAGHVSNRILCLEGERCVRGRCGIDYGDYYEDGDGGDAAGDGGDEYYDLYGDHQAKGPLRLEDFPAKSRRGKNATTAAAPRRRRKPAQLVQPAN